MSDNPQDQSSRWSGAFQGNTTDQWIVLRLESLSVLGEFR
jgi:muskelin